MRPGFNNSPLNPVPVVVWVLLMPILATEAVFALGQLGFVGGGDSLRIVAIERTAFVPEYMIRLWQVLDIAPLQVLRILTYPFVHFSFTHALFVGVFLLALGNMVAGVFRPVAVIVLFLGSAIGGALVYTLVAALLPGVRFPPLVGGYPAVYGLVGAFNFILWTRLSMVNANRLQAFTLIGMLLLFQLVFGVLFGGSGKDWIAEIAGFGTGFLLSFLLVPGGWDRLRRQLRQR